MVDRIRKNLAKFSESDRKRLLDLIKRIQNDDLRGLDVKKLKGRSDALRVRKGNFRIIFARRKDQSVRLIAIERRSESTYKDES